MAYFTNMYLMLYSRPFKMVQLNSDHQDGKTSPAQ